MWGLIIGGLAIGLIATYLVVKYDSILDDDWDNWEGEDF